jgi:hypothetical protein
MKALLHEAKYNFRDQLLLRFIGDAEQSAGPTLLEGPSIL